LKWFFTSKKLIYMRKSAGKFAIHGIHNRLAVTLTDDFILATGIHEFHLIASLDECVRNSLIDVIVITGRAGSAACSFTRLDAH
jgi:hypothetical protein